MALKRRFAEKTEELLAQAADTDGAPRPAKVASTAPGQMLAFRDQMESATAQIETLESQLKQFEGSKLALYLDASQIKPSPLANRHPRSFEGPEYERLKADIALAGGNVQPIKVRPTGTDGKDGYETVFGHRRHRACLELGMRVLVVVEPLSDAELFAQMDRENREREDLSPYELGQH